MGCSAVSFVRRHAVRARPVMLVAMMATSPALAEPTLGTCNGIAVLTTAVEPWAEASRSYANGTVRIVHVDTDGEPVCCSSHLAVLYPRVEDGPPGRECVLVSDGAFGMGFLDLSVPDASASYDTERGLLISVPVERYDGVRGADPARAERVVVRVNQATGRVTLE